MQADRLLVIVDFSWWLNLAFRVAGVEGMAPIVIGRLVELLRGDVAACLAVALDSVGPTWRHDITEGLPREQAYKGTREPKPREFYALSNRLIDVVRMHRIPIFAAEGWEADDCFAAAVPHARAAGLEVAILTADKDLGQLVGDGVVLWDGGERVRGPAEIFAEWYVEPALLGDLLAIVGDSSDNVRGVPGLGPVRAAELLLSYGDLETALALPPEPVSEQEIKAAEKVLAAAKRAASKPSATGAEHRAADVAKGALERLRERRNVARDLSLLQRHADDVRLARRLVQLDAAAPIEWNPSELPVGGYDVAAIRRAYLSLGFHNLASEVRTFPKAALPETDEDRMRREWADEDEEAEAGRSAPATGAKPAAMVVSPPAPAARPEARPAPSPARAEVPREHAGEGAATGGAWSAEQLDPSAPRCGSVRRKFGNVCEKPAGHEGPHIGDGSMWIDLPGYARGAA